MAYKVGEVWFESYWGSGKNKGRHIGESINECLRAFLATRCRECGVYQMECNADGFGTHKIGLNGQGSYSRRFTRQEAKAALGIG